ncbi:MAG: hypothetical protein GX558_04760 [Clostridiales bacterium]|nr:hypothetical protein [Clostridiales bacterium]
MKEHWGGRRYFEGWYFKQQCGGDTVALIPALHVDDAGRASASLQVIADTQAHVAWLPADSLAVDRGKRVLKLGDSTFSASGCSLNLHSEGCALRGALRFGPLAPPSRDIMGPFCAVPLMECRHSVFSMYHRVDGAMAFNGREYRFDNGAGYIEGDRGTSFPDRYVWTQCCWEGNSVMLSVADIPFGAFRFIGLIGFVLLAGRERRIATYCGARPLHVGDDEILVRQGGLLLAAKLLAANEQPLRAPRRGDMARTIHESVSCTVRYTCVLDGRVLFDFISERASFEGNWRNGHEPAI